MRSHSPERARSVRLGIAEVPGEDARTAHPELTRGDALAHLAGLGVGEADVDVRVRATDRARVPGGLRGRQAQHVRGGLGEPVPLRQRHPAAGPRVEQRRRHRRAAHERGAQVREIGCREPGVIRQQLVLRGHAHHRRDPALLQQLEHAGRLERALQHHGRPDPPRQQRLAVPCGDVELRQHREHDVVGCQLHGAGEREVVPEAVRVGQHDALRRGLAARGEDDQHRVVIEHGASLARDAEAGVARRHRRLDPGRAERRDRRGSGILDGAHDVHGVGDDRFVLVLDQHELRVRPLRDAGQLARRSAARTAGRRRRRPSRTRRTRRRGRSSCPTRSRCGRRPRSPRDAARARARAHGPRGRGSRS